MASVPKLSELEGLRGWLAWWVVIGHSLIEAGWDASWLPTLGKLIISPGLAVKVFIILSGFVITLLLDKKKTSYRDFILTRAFRLFPLYYVMLAVGISAIAAVHSFYPAYLSHIDTPSRLFARYETWQGHIDHMAAHLSACLLGLHGAIPNSLLPHAHSAYLSQGWSISLEWQFYLVAPIIWWALQKRFGLIVTGAVFYILLGVRHHFAIGGWSSFLPQSIEFFALGSISYFACKHVHLGSASAQLYSRAFASVLLLVIAFVSFLPSAVFSPWGSLTGTNSEVVMGLWLTVLMLVLARKYAPDERLTRWVSYPFTNRVALYLGRISYSTYLGHYFVIFALQWAMLQFAPAHINKWTMALVLCTVGSVLTLLLSIVTHKIIEIPGIELGKKILSARRPPAPRVSSPLIPLPSLNAALTKDAHGNAPSNLP